MRYTLKMKNRPAFWFGVWCVCIVGFVTVQISDLPPSTTQTLVGCGATKQDARDATKAVMDAKDIACVFGSFVVDEHALAKVCHVADSLAPVIRDLIGQREGARRSGVFWPSSSDGGATPFDAGKDASSP